MPDFGQAGGAIEGEICGEPAAIRQVHGLEFGLPGNHG